MKRVCVLSYTGLNDSRAQRTIRSMSAICPVDFFYIGDTGSGSTAEFNSNVSLFPITEPKSNILRKIKTHSYNYLNGKFFFDHISTLNREYSVIYAHDFPTSYPAFLLAKTNTKARIIYDIHDLYLETINQFFPSENKGLRKLLFGLSSFLIKSTGSSWESKFIKHVDLVVTTNENYKDHICANYPVKKILITPNFPEYRDVPSTTQLYDHFKIDRSRQIVLYHGALNPGRYLELIVKSGKLLPENLVLVIIGSGSLKGKLIALADDHVNKKIFFGDFVDYNNLFGFISSASLGIMLIEHINLSKKYALANKVTEYMACGIPVLASDSPENVRIIDDAKCGFITTLDQPEKLALFISDLFVTQNLRKVGENGRNAFRTKYNWEIHEPVFRQEFMSLLH